MQGLNTLSPEGETEPERERERERETEREGERKAAEVICEQGESRKRECQQMPGERKRVIDSR